MHFIEANGVVQSCQIDGRTDHPALVFLNSLGSDLRIWDDVVPHLAENFYVIRCDKRGHGLSTCPPPPYSMPDLSQDLYALLQQLEVEQVVLIGISVGGMIAQDFAARWPDLVSGLVLCDTAAKIGTDELWNERIDALRQHGMEHLADTIVSRWFTPDFATARPAAYQGYRQMLTRTMLDGYTGVCEAIRDADLTAASSNLQTPTLVLCGAKDVATPPELVWELAELMPRATYKEIIGAGHIPSIEQPQLLAEEIAAFLREIGYG